MKSKERFLADKARAGRWNDLTASGDWQAAVDMAMLEMLERQRGKIGPVYDAQAAAHRLSGAAEFETILSKLGLRELPVRASEPTKLEYEEFDVQNGMKPTFSGTNSGLEQS